MDSRIDTITTKKHRGRTRIRNIVKKVLQRLEIRFCSTKYMLTDFNNISLISVLLLHPVYVIFTHNVSLEYERNKPDYLNTFVN